MNFQCLFLDRLFAGEEVLQKSMKSKQVEWSIKKKWAFTECDYSSDFKRNYLRQLVTHSKVKAHNSDTCGNCFT